MNFGLDITQWKNTLKCLLQVLLFSFSLSFCKQFHVSICRKYFQAGSTVQLKMTGHNTACMLSRCSRCYRCQHAFLEDTFSFPISSLAYRPTWSTWSGLCGFHEGTFSAAQLAVKSILLIVSVSKGAQASRGKSSIMDGQTLYPPWLGW